MTHPLLASHLQTLPAGLLERLRGAAGVVHSDAYSCGNHMCASLHRYSEFTRMPLTQQMTFQSSYMSKSTKRFLERHSRTAL